MEADQVRSRQQREQKRRDVTVAEHNLGIGRNQVEIDEGQRARGAPSSPQGDDAADFVIGKRRVDVGRPVRVAAGQVTVSGHDMLADPDPQPKRFKRLHGDQQLVLIVGDRCRSHERHQVALA